MPLDRNAPCTVCIPTYNQAEYLRDAVLSVALQTAPVRLLVSNDASPDNTVEVLRELQEQYEFVAVNQPRNLGISANLQWLLRAAETPLIMRLDSDDVLHPEYIAELSALLERYPKAGYAHCAIQDIDAEGKALRERRLARSDVFQDAETALRRAVGGYQVTANVLLFRREALLSVDFGAGSEKVNFVEDYDLSVRLADAGWGNVYSNKVLASYRIWHAASRPAVGRKLTEIRGVTHIFEESLARAFRKRGWPMEVLARRRAALALANAEILDRGEFAPGQREEMAEALLGLSDRRLARMAVGPGPLAYLVRRTIAMSGVAQQRMKYLLKRLLFRS